MLLAPMSTPPAQVAQADPVPSLRFHRRAWVPSRTAGRGTVFTGVGLAGIRDRGQWILFDPSDPMGPHTQFVDLPDKAVTSGAHSVVREGWLYATRGRTIFRRTLAEEAWQKWFEAPRPFSAFEVTGIDRVTLLFPETLGPDDKPSFLEQKELEPGRFQRLDTPFAEVWDTTSESLVRRYDLPAELLELERLLRGTRYQIWTARSEDDLLVYLEGLGHLYLLERGRGDLIRIPTPWRTLEPAAMRELHRGMPKGARAGVTTGDFLPSTMTITPAEGGGFRFAYWDMPLDESLFEREGYSPIRPREGEVILRPPQLPKGKAPTTPYGTLAYHSWAWAPGKQSLQPYRATHPVDPHESSNWATEAGNRTLNDLTMLSGTFLTPEGEFQPMATYLHRMRVLYASRKKVPLPKSPGQRMNEEADKAREAEQAKAAAAPSAPPQPTGTPSAAKPEAGKVAEPAAPPDSAKRPEEKTQKPSKA